MMINDSRAFKARGFGGVEPIRADGGWNASEFWAEPSIEFRLICDPDDIVIRAVRRSSVYKARASIVGNMITVEKRNLRILALRS